MSFDTITTIRPSAMGALSECPKYLGRETSSGAAARGTRIDAAIRASLAGQSFDTTGFDRADLDAIEWANAYIREAAGDTLILCGEDDTRVTDPIPGTCDTILPAKNHTLDVKTGRQRNYDGQMACYAAGAMNRYFEDAWRTTVLYVDLEIAEWRNWTMDEAMALVRGITAEAKDPLAAPRPCDYCVWCAHAATCPPRVEALTAMYPGLSAVLSDWDAILADPVRLGAVLQACKPLRSFVDDQLPDAREAAEKHIVEGRAVPGARLVTVKPSPMVSILKQGHWIPELGFDAILSMHRPVSLSAFSKMWAEKKPGQPMPANIADMEKAGYSYIRIDNPKPNT